MAKLVEFLAAGINGAANGSATFVLRGTASSAASVLYNDFEATTQPGTNIITLDANGAAEVYTDAYCDVTLKTSAGVTLRTVTVGNAATTVEVISDSFTGTDYSGSPTAVNEPITLAAVLNKWDDSAGADDWKVAVNGVATNLSAAFSAIGGLFFNVKDPTYGAVGDGVTDDTTAIGLAITAAVAAGGGIVFFPATTSFYLITSLSISAANITLMGVGPNASVIRSATTSANVISFSDNTANTWKRIIGLGIVGTGTNNNFLLETENEQNIYIENCHFSASSYTDAMISRNTTHGLATIIMKDCLFTVGTNVDGACKNRCDFGHTNWIIRNSRFVIDSGFTGHVILGSEFNIDGCYFDASAVTSGLYHHINSTAANVSGKYVGRFTNNTFADGGSTGYAFQLATIATDSDFYEDGNIFIGFTAPTSLTDAGQIYNVSHDAHDAAKVFLGSRRGRTIEITQSTGGAVTADIFQSYETVYVNYTATANLNVNFPVDTMTSGAEVSLALLNNSGAQRDIVAEMGASDFSLNATTNGGAVSSPVTEQPLDTEVVYWKGYYVHIGSGHPWFILTTSIET